MRFVELIIEGYKEAQRDFEQVEDPVIVADTIQTYKNLVNKNQFSGLEKKYRLLEETRVVKFL